MGRPSKLTKEQWLLVEHRHVVDGVAIKALAREYSIDESALRRKIKPSVAERAKGIPTLRDLAEKKAEAVGALQVVDAAIAELPVTRQIIVNDLAARLQSVSVHLTCAAETSARTASKLAAIAEAQVNRINVKAPIDDKAREIVQGAAYLTKTANEAGALGMGLLTANRDMMRTPAQSPDAEELADLTDDELDEELRKHGVV